MSHSPWPPTGDEQRHAPASPHSRRASGSSAPDHDPLVHDSDARSVDRTHDTDDTDDTDGTDDTDDTGGAEAAPRVIVADDDPDVRDALRLILEDAGYSVVEAADGIEAMDALHVSLPSVVLLDVLLPGISGF